MSTEIEIQSPVNSPEVSPPDSLAAPRPEADPAGHATSELAGGESKAVLRKISPRKLESNRANARKSTGPRTERGKKRARLNGFMRRRSVRLLGLAEARTLRQEPGAAEQLYAELIAPYQPAPAILAMHFQDLARLHLELEAWERIRDAQLEHRWQQNDIERRKRYQEMQTDLPGTTQDLADRGLCRLDDSAAKFRRQAECLELLKKHLQNRDFDIEHILHVLWGKDLQPVQDRAQIICIRCRKLLPPQDEDLGEPASCPPEDPGARPSWPPEPPGARATRPRITKKELQLLIDLVEDEYRVAMNAYLLKLDEKTMTRFECLAGLGATTLEDQRLQRQGQTLRQAIDRKQRVINAVLRMLGLSKERELERDLEG
ncbi:MAG TPA: hypothetical protein VGZ29_08810 [Terriglobia bacterium]|nr:hypothetical protein [Terriglobia bacterium]